MICDTVRMTREIKEDEQDMVPIRYLELDGERKEIQSCYGDIIIIINAMADYAGLLDDYRRMYPERQRMNTRPTAAGKSRNPWNSRWGMTGIRPSRNARGAVPDNQMMMWVRRPWYSLPERMRMRNGRRRRQGILLNLSKRRQSQGNWKGS